MLHPQLYKHATWFIYLAGNFLNEMSDKEKKAIYLCYKSSICLIKHSFRPIKLVQQMALVGPVELDT